MIVVLSFKDFGLAKGVSLLGGISGTRGYVWVLLTQFGEVKRLYAGLLISVLLFNALILNAITATDLNSTHNLT